MKAANPVYPTSRFPNEVDPHSCPQLYASFAKGRCLEPVFSDGECFAFDTDAEITPGDYVGIWLYPDRVQDGELPRRVKRVRSLMPLVELEQFNPPRVYRVPADEILAMHKVVGTAIIDGQGTARVVPLDVEKTAGPCLVRKISV